MLIPHAISGRGDLGRFLSRAVTGNVARHQPIRVSRVKSGRVP